MDNIQKIGSHVLAQALTGSIWEERLLGGNEVLRVPQKVGWVATGNQVTLDRDLANRCYLVSLDAKTAHPEKRTTFKHSHIERWVQEHRAALLGDVITMCLSWVAAGQPSVVTRPMGAFTRWASVLGNVLAYADVAGFLENSQQIKTDGDVESTAWLNLALAWYRQLQTPVSLGDLISGKVLMDSERDGEHVFSEYLPDEVLQIPAENRALRTKVLGYALRPQNGKRFRLPNGTGDIWFEHALGPHHTREWRVTTTGCAIVEDISNGAVKCGKHRTVCKELKDLV